MDDWEYSVLYDLWTHHKSDMSLRFQIDFSDFFYEVAGLKDASGQFLQLYLASRMLTGNLSYRIGDFKSLQELYLGNNCLTSLPAEIGLLTSLRELDVSANQVTQLPPQISNLTALEHLNVTDNRLSILPPQIGSLINLRALRADKNYLTHLPEEISRLSATLQTLTLHENGIATFPLPILTLTSLQILDMAYNDLASIPPEIERLSHLWSLRIQGNRLSWIPSTLGKLDNMEELYLHDNDLSTIPSSILENSRPRLLVVSGNCLMKTYTINEKDNKSIINQMNQRLPTKLQLEAFASCPMVRESLRPNFRLICRGVRLMHTLIPFCIDAESLAQRWPYLRNLLKSDMHESQTRILYLHEYFSIRLMHIIVALFYGEMVNLGDLDERDCQNVIDHGGQFHLDKPLELLVTYCKARIDASSKVISTSIL